MDERAHHTIVAMTNGERPVRLWIGCAVWNGSGVACCESSRAVVLHAHGYAGPARGGGAKASREASLAVNASRWLSFRRPTPPACSTTAGGGNASTDGENAH